MGFKKMAMIAPVAMLAFIGMSTDAMASVSVSVDASSGVMPVSPYLYGRNIYCNEDRGDINDVTDTLSAKELDNLETYRQAGIRYLRMNNGNNATKHNWRKNLTSHPDYYNNVYKHNWDISAKKVLDNLPGVDAMYAFQLTGYVASSMDYNFADWNWKQAHGKNAKQSLNLAGGGQVADDGETLVQAGNSSLYLQEWPADSSAKILTHWKDELKYDMERLKYWSMDNEMELWRGTHDDLPLDFPDNSTVAPERMINNYVAVAKAAKARYPDVKLTGPVVANEWSWCNIRYDDNSEGKAVTSFIKASDRNYCWLEYFIKRLGEEQKKTNIQLLDVFDLHWYPTEKNYESWINWHRVFYDTTYNYPGANGIKRANETCKWDETITKEYIFKRIDDWMKKYVGADYKYTFGFTETDFIADMDAMTRALVYASFMGTFMDHGVEIFTPWTWREGMYEVVHLFSRYGKRFRVDSPSSLDSLVSAYTTVNGMGDSMTVILVNRAENTSQSVDLNVSNFELNDGNYATLTLSGITGETFVSHEKNALRSGSVSLQSKRASLTLPAKSITAVLFTGKGEIIAESSSSLKQTSSSSSVNQASSSSAVPQLTYLLAVQYGDNKLLFFQDGRWFVNNLNGMVSQVEIFNSLGQRLLQVPYMARGSVRLPTDGLLPGVYLVRLKTMHGYTLERISLEN
ncbi:MAG: glycoside hydrolase [Fibrobacter sp.]|nr:glycoside hydrolase [Fibrobacter sp.]